MIESQIHTQKTVSLSKEVLFKDEGGTNEPATMIILPTLNDSIVIVFIHHFGQLPCQTVSLLRGPFVSCHLSPSTYLP